MSRYIAHWGIKGQKWGVRLFQNEDGTLTEEGKIRYGVNGRESFEEQKRSTNPGLQRYATDDGAYVIKKGTKIHRMATEGEPIDDRIKYVSLTNDDASFYHEIGIDGGLWVNDPARMKEYEYTAIKDIKVANFREVLNVIASVQNEPFVKQAIEEYDSNVAIRDKIREQDRSAADEYEAARSYSTGETVVKDFMKTPKFRDTLVKELSKRNYSGMVDPEDFTYADFPVVLFNPKQNIAFS